MSARIVIRSIAVLALVGLLVVIISGGEKPYTAKLRMENASGLRDGSQVTIGGIVVGKVRLKLDKPAGRVVAELQIDDKHQPLPQSTTAAIVAQNVLGQKQVQLTTDSGGTPAPSGFVIPASRTTKTTDLDQLLNVLDANTRTRLEILINEAGQAFTGRRADFSRFLRVLPANMVDVTSLLEQLNQDNTALDRLVATGSRYVHQTTARRKDLVRLLDRVGQTSTTIAARRQELRSTLASAPAFLSNARSFLAQLRQTTGPLNSAAVKLTATAKPLDEALTQISPFEKAARPTLQAAVKVAPDLERLAAGATPVIKQAAPTLTALRSVASGDLPAVTRTVDRSVDNILAVLENWSRVVQFRDGLGHVFRGEASIAPDALASAVSRLTPTAAATNKTTKTTTPTTSNPAATKPGAAAAPSAKPKLPDAVKKTTDVVDSVLDDLLGKLARRPSPKTPDTPSSAPGPSASSLLDYLLGN
jgi:virulence factor Mce-like protein